MKSHGNDKYNLQMNDDISDLSFSSVKCPEKNLSQRAAEKHEDIENCQKIIVFCLGFGIKYGCYANMQEDADPLILVLLRTNKWVVFYMKLFIIWDINYNK